MAILQKIRANSSEILRYLIVFFFGLASVRTLIAGRFVPTHDAEYHIIRLWQFDKMFRAGQFFPRWAPDLDFGYGSPVLMFFYPLPNYVGELFTLIGASYIASVHLTLASGLTFSGITFYAWIRRHVNGWPAVVAAIAYMLAPYHLVDVFIRGSVGEVWGLATIPLLLLSIHNLASRSPLKKIGISFVALSTVLVLLSHNLIGVLGLLFAALYGLVLLASESDCVKRRLIYLVIGYGLGILLTSFYYVPVIVESSYMSGFDIVSAHDHFPALFQLLFPSWGSGFSVAGIGDQMSFQIGIVHILAIFAVGLLAMIKRSKVALYMVLASLVCIFLMLEYSSFIWSSVPGIQLIQYPWRFLSIVAITSSFCIGYLANWKKLFFVPALLVLTLASYWNYTNAVTYESREDSVYLTNPDWSAGNATLGNTFVIKDSLSKTEYAKSIIEIVSGSADISTIKHAPTHIEAQIVSSEEIVVRVSVNYFPGWRVYVNHEEVLKINDQGLISFPLSNGNHSIIIVFGTTNARRAGVFLSVFSLIVVASLPTLEIYERLFTRRTT